MAASVEEVLARDRPEGQVYRPGQKAPFSGTYVCDRGTMLAPVRVQLSRGKEFPRVAGLGEHTRWRATNIQA